MQQEKYEQKLPNTKSGPGLGRVSRKKVAVLLDFVQITSNPPLPPLPPIWTTCTTFFYNANVPKKLGRGLPLPPHPQIDPIYTVCEKWTQTLGIF